MISNYFDFLNTFKKSPLLAFIKFEPTFLTGSLAVCLSAPVQGEPMTSFPNWRGYKD